MRSDFLEDFDGPGVEQGDPGNEHSVHNAADTATYTLISEFQMGRIPAVTGV
jgi:hypothetical protein